jgi:hypothetical protein
VLAQSSTIDQYNDVHLDTPTGRRHEGTS